MCRGGECVFINSSCLHAATPPQGAQQPATTRAILVNPNLLCSNGYDILQSRYLSPLIAGDLHTVVHIKPEYEQGARIIDEVESIYLTHIRKDYGSELLIKSKLYTVFYALFSLSEQLEYNLYPPETHTKNDFARLKKRSPISIPIWTRRSPSASWPPT